MTHEEKRGHALILAKLQWECDAAEALARKLRAEALQAELTLASMQKEARRLGIEVPR